MGKTQDIQNSDQQITQHSWDQQETTGMECQPPVMVTEIQNPNRSTPEYVWEATFLLKK